MPVVSFPPLEFIKYNLNEKIRSLSRNRIQSRLGNYIHDKETTCGKKHVYKWQVALSNMSIRFHVSVGTYTADSRV